MTSGPGFLSLEQRHRDPVPRARAGLGSSAPEEPPRGLFRRTVHAPRDASILSAPR
jgi:hypothetical protein